MHEGGGSLELQGQPLGSSLFLPLIVEGAFWRLEFRRKLEALSDKCKGSDFGCSIRIAQPLDSAVGTSRSGCLYSLHVLVFLASKAILRQLGCIYL